MSRKILISLLAVVLILSLMGQALALVKKDEVVYAALNRDGSVKNIYVVNTFESDEETAVLDHGAYARVLPLGTSKDFDYKDGEASFVMSPGRFAYQGDLEQKILPWDITLSYTLDGAPVDALALSGAQGQVEGTIKVVINKDYEALASALSLQISVSLDGDKSFNIVSPKATIAHAAGNLMLTYVVLPGHEASYAFSFTARDFSMPAIQIAGVKMGMDEDMYKEAASRAMRGTPLETTVGNLMTGFLNSMKGQTAPSFTDSNNQVQAVQFVMMTEEIPEKTPEKPAETAPEPEKGSFFERLLKLLGL